MKAIHVVAAALFLAATVLLFLGQTEAAIGLCVLSTFLEIGWSILTGKSKNT